MNKIAIPVFETPISPYMDALKYFGADPEMIHTAEIDINQFDGLLLPGGVDINPLRYGQQNTESREVSEELDELQFRILDLFVKAGKPVLGVCRGLQVINVYFGGTLQQDIAMRKFHYGERLQSSQNEDGRIIDRVHGSCISSDSWLCRLYGERASINSFHHQAVDRLGKGLKTVQLSESGIVEGIVHETLPVYAVQWHPERCGLSRSRKDTVDGSLIYGYFVEQCKKFVFLQEDYPAVKIEKQEG